MPPQAAFGRIIVPPRFASPPIGGLPVGDILRVTGPCSRLFQATTTDLSVAASTVSNCTKSALQSRRSDRKHFDTVVSTAKMFASEHDINPEFSHQRRKIRRRYADGTVDPPGSAHEEESNSAENYMYVNLYLPAIDFVLSDLATRFHDTVMPVIGQMMTFSAGSLLNLCTDVKAADVSELCNHYELDVDHVVRELNSFVSIFKANHMIVNMSDIARPETARSVTGGGDDSQTLQTPLQ